MPIDTLQNRLFPILDQFAIISMTDARGIITYVNKQFCDISGYTKEELIGQPHNIIRHPDNPPSFFETLWQQIAKHEMFHDTIKNRDKAGNDYYVDTYIFPIVDESGNISQYLSLRYDVTALTLAKRHLIANERKKEQMLQTFSHELLTPLNAINGLLNVLYDKEKHHEKRSLLKTTRNAANHLHAMLDDIIHLSRIDAKQLEPHATSFVLESEIKQCVKQFVLEANKKWLSFTLFIAPQLSYNIFTDRTFFYKIITHIISNAIKFTPVEGKVHIEAYQKEEQVCIEVTDSGIGIAPEHLERIFEPFAQADMQRTRQHEGMGNGLHVARSLAAMIDASITVHSERNRGSTFTITLPFNADAAHQHSSQPPQQLSGILYNALHTHHNNAHIQQFERYLATQQQQLNLIESVNEADGVLLTAPNAFSTEELELLCMQKQRIVCIHPDPLKSFPTTLLQHRTFFILHAPFSLGSLASLQAQIEKLDARILFCEPNKLATKRLQMMMEPFRTQCTYISDVKQLQQIDEKVPALYVNRELLISCHEAIKTFIILQHERFAHQCDVYLFGDALQTEVDITYQRIQTPIIDTELIESVSNYL